MAHAVKVASLLAALGREGAVKDGQTEAGPLLPAVGEGRQSVAILHVDRHDGERPDMPAGIYRRNAFPREAISPIAVSTSYRH